MKIILIAIVLLSIAFILKACTSKKTTSTVAESNLNSGQLPVELKDNDKLIEVSGVTNADIQKALQAFCNMYNQNGNPVLPRLWQLSTDRYVITFPYDIDFPTYCFCVNYLKYPSDIKWNASVKGWTTANADDEWLTSALAGKKLMLYLTPDDKEYDNVFVTTEDNIGYKIEFTGRNNPNQLSQPKQSFQTPSVAVNQLKDLTYKDFR